MKMPKGSSHGPSKPRFRARKINVAGKSAFPQGPAAFSAGAGSGAPDPSQAFDAPGAGTGGMPPGGAPGDAQG
jgi:hypothetical protein